MRNICKNSLYMAASFIYKMSHPHLCLLYSAHNISSIAYPHIYPATSNKPNTPSAQILAFVVTQLLYYRRNAYTKYKRQDYMLLLLYFQWCIILWNRIGIVVGFSGAQISNIYSVATVGRIYWSDSERYTFSARCIYAVPPSARLRGKMKINVCIFGKNECRH